MQINVFKDFSSSLKKSVYQELLSRSDAHTVFNEWAWVAASYRHLPADWQALIITVQDDTGLMVACFTLKYGIERRYAVSVRAIRSVQHPLADRIGIPCDRRYQLPLPELVQTLSQHGYRYDVLELDELYDAAQLEICRKVTRASSKPGCLQLQRLTPVVAFAGKSVAEIEAGYPQNLRRKLRRCRNKLANYQHAIRFYTVASADVDHVLEELRIAETASWKGEEGVGIFSNQAKFEFFLDLSRELALTGQLAVGEIRVNGELASYRYGFICNRVFYDYNLAYTPEYRHLGAGRLLLDEIIRQCASQGFDAVDGSRTQMDTSNLLVERSEARIAHYCWTYCRITPAGIWVAIVLKLLRPLRKQLIQLYKRLKPTKIPG